VEGKVYGWHIPYLENKRDFHAGRGRILLVGDASNSVDPFRDFLTIGERREH
jgi:hypothetical protein